MLTLDPMRVSVFYNFMAEREQIRLNRAEGLPRAEWTKNRIFQDFSFTNIKRSHDRTTYLLKQEFYDRYASDAPMWKILLNCAIFRFTGTIDAARILGWSDSWDRARFIHLGPIIPFTGAYIIPNAGRPDPKFVVVADVIDSIVDNMDNVLLGDAWERWSAELCNCYGCGSFMSKEVLLDYILATSHVPSDWETWTPVGPGARKGAGWVLKGEIDSLKEDDALEVCRQLYDERHSRWKHEISLDLTDIQFQLCELAKYMKVVIDPTARLKRRFRPTVDEVTCGSDRSKSASSDAGVCEENV